VTIALPRERWRATGGNPAKRYIYGDAKGLSGPIRSVQLSATALALRGAGADLFGLDHAPQGTMAVRLQLGTALQFCAAAPAKADRVQAARAADLHHLAVAVVGLEIAVAPAAGLATGPVPAGQWRRVRLAGGPAGEGDPSAAAARTCAGGITRAARHADAEL